MPKLGRCSITLSLIFGCCIGRAWADVLTGVDLELTPPPGFSQAQAFTGFQNIQAFASIEVEEYATSYRELAATLDDATLASRGMGVESRESIDGRDRDTLLIKLDPLPPTLPFSQWMLVIGDSLRSVLVTASYPAFAAEYLDAPVEASLRGARWRRSPQQQLFYDLPFVVSETQDLKYRRRTPNMLIMSSAADSDVGMADTSASLVIGYRSADQDLPELDALARAHLYGLKGMEVLELIDESETQMDGIAALRSIARVRPRVGGEVRVFEQIIASQKDKYLLVQASAPESLSRRYSPQFAAAVDSIRFKPVNQ